MKQLLKFALFLLLPFFSVAQSNYKPGYVVTGKGDTLKGYIDYQAWDSNPASFTFKQALADKEKRNFSLTDAAEIGINGITTYKKYTVSVSTDITNTSHLMEGRDTTFKMATVFLKVLQMGKNLALYQYTDDMKTRFYIGETPGFQPTELVFRLYYNMAKTGGGRTVYENGYQKQLFALANKYGMLTDDVINRLQKAEYQKDDLLEIVTQINQISKTEFEAKYRQRSKFSFYAGGLANISLTSSAAQSPYSLGGGLSHTSVMPGIAIGADFVPDANGGRAEFRLNLSVNPARMDAKYQLKVNPYVPAEVSYDQLGIFLTPQAMYNFYNAPDFKFYMGVGFAVTYLSHSNGYFQSPDHSAPAPGFPDEPFYFNSIDDNIMFCAGFRIHKNIEIYYNYNTNAAATQAGYFAFNSNNQVIGVNYFFGQ